MSLSGAKTRYDKKKKTEHVCTQKQTTVSMVSHPPATDSKADDFYSSVPVHPNHFSAYSGPFRPFAASYLSVLLLYFFP